MLPLRTFAPWLLLAFLGQQVSVSSSAASGRGKFSTKDKMQCTWGAKDVGDTVNLRVTCENPEARIKGGVTDQQCEYNGKPQKCPGYQSNPRGFWKQVGRAFKRLQSKLCNDDRALVKAGMCKRAPGDAHFKLDITSSVASAQSKRWPPPPPPMPTSRKTKVTGSSNSTCTKSDHQKKAEEYCSSSWASVCSFFLSMLQSEDC